MSDLQYKYKPISPVSGASQFPSGYCESQLCFQGFIFSGFQPIFSLNKKRSSLNQSKRVTVFLACFGKCAFDLLDFHVETSFVSFLLIAIQRTELHGRKEKKKNVQNLKS